MAEHIQDNDLQNRLRAEDKSALEFVYKSYKSEFLNFSQRYKVDYDDALDAYQDAVIAMYQNFVMNELELTNSSIKTYLFGIGKHKIYRIVKSKQKQLKIENDIEEFRDIEPKGNDLNYYQVELAKLIGNISESCRELLRLYYYRNLSINEIVERTQYKDTNTVKSHKSRCMKRLKSLVSSS